MSTYVICKINYDIEAPLLRDMKEEEGKPVEDNINYYFGKSFGAKGSSLPLRRSRTNQEAEEDVDNVIIRNEGGIIMLRLHNKKKVELVQPSGEQTSDIKNYDTRNEDTFPYGYVIIDNRKGYDQVAIELTPSWYKKYETIQSILQDFFKQYFGAEYGYKVEVKAKMRPVRFQEFLDERLMGKKDAIQSFSFEFTKMKNYDKTNSAEIIDNYYQLLKESKASKLFVSIDYDENQQEEDKKMGLLKAVQMCSANAFNLKVKFRDYGPYICGEDVLAKFEMGDLVFNNFMKGTDPEIIDDKHDLASWLDKVYMDTKIYEDGQKTPAKPKRNNKK